MDNFALASPIKDIAKAIYNIIGKPLMHLGKEEPPFAYMGFVDNYDDVQEEQFSQRWQIS